MTFLQGSTQFHFSTDEIKSTKLGFSKYPISKQQFQHLVICASCTDTAVHSEIDYGLSKSTSNIKSHVATHHKPEYDVCVGILEPFMESEKYVKP